MTKKFGIVFFIKMKYDTFKTYLIYITLEHINPIEIYSKNMHFYSAFN